MSKSPNSSGDAPKSKNDRSIFEYMECPPNAADWVKDQFANCAGGCRMLVPASALPDEGKHLKGCDLCVVLGSQEKIDGRPDKGSCGEYAIWPTPDCTPDPDVVKEHAAKLAQGAPGSATKEEVGYVERPVRCKNCEFGGEPKCQWYEELNEKLGDYFEEKRSIEPGACCNSQTAPAEKVRASDSRDRIAFDRASVRTTDSDGRMHVAVTNISKANVCPYLGSEIPDFEKLGLEPDKIYQLYRAPEELEKAAHTFNNIQLLIKHTSVSADDHQPDEVIGTTGSEAEFVAPYLRNSLAVWVRKGIDLIDSEKQKELSSGYRYRADMTPGHTPKGEAFDGVMRDIEGNHVAIVKEGRAGPDVVVGDSAIPINYGAFEMKTKLLSRKAAVSQGALMVYLQPKLAKDAKIDLTPFLAGVTSKNFKDKKASIVAGVKDATKGKLAKDATIDDVKALLDNLDGVETAEAVDEEMDDDTTAVDADPVEGLRAHMKSIGATDEDTEKAVAFMKPKTAADAEETAEEKAAREKREKESGATANDSDKDDKDMVSKKAMDAAVKLAGDSAARRAEDATMKRLTDIRVAERAVEPLIGKPAVALDSAEKIYAAALKAHDVNTEGVDPSAFPSMVDMLVKNKAVPRQNHHHQAQDAASTTDRQEFEKQHGIAPRRIRNLGG